MNDFFSFSKFSAPLELDAHLLKTLLPLMFLHFQFLAIKGRNHLVRWNSSFIKFAFEHAVELLAQTCHFFVLWFAEPTVADHSDMLRKAESFALRTSI